MPTPTSLPSYDDSTTDLIEAYRAAAREQYAREGVLEIDDNAQVSLGSDPGAYVQAWVWVPNEALPNPVVDAHKLEVDY